MMKLLHRFWGSSIYTELSELFGVVKPTHKQPILHQRKLRVLCRSPKSAWGRFSERHLVSAIESIQGCEALVLPDGTLRVDVKM